MKTRTIKMSHDDMEHFYRAPDGTERTMVYCMRCGSRRGTISHGAGCVSVELPDGGPGEDVQKYPNRASVDSLSYCRELDDFFSLFEALCGLRSNLGPQLEAMAGHATFPENVEHVRKGPRLSDEHDPHEAKTRKTFDPVIESADRRLNKFDLAAIRRFNKTWRVLRTIPGKYQEALSGHYQGRRLCETDAAAAHRAYYDGGGRRVR